jgi:hypothetical protein
MNEIMLFVIHFWNELVGKLFDVGNSFDFQE